MVAFIKKDMAVGKKAKYVFDYVHTNNPAVVEQFEYAKLEGPPEFVFLCSASQDTCTKRRMKKLEVEELTEEQQQEFKDLMM